MFDSPAVAKPFIFANDTKLLMAVYTPEHHSLQHDLYNLPTLNNSLLTPPNDFIFTIILVTSDIPLTAMPLIVTRIFKNLKFKKN